jgi:HD-GYP domain-containing protein (c-di-GMP phosphodiesterase class II)
LAVAVSVAIASAEAALWTRRSGSRDLVFADLMLWGWLRRCWTERRLAQARALYDSARKAGPAVSIKLLEDLSKRLEARDAYTHGHSQRVARHAECIARAMHLSAAEIAKIRTAATVHDVGKIYTPREILNNPRRLTDREYAIVKLHPSDGADMLAAVGDPEIATMVRHHHERIDGDGYPDGLAGEEIPLGARIISVCDAYDAMVTDRPYRRGTDSESALAELRRCAGSQFDPAVVEAFCAVIGRVAADQVAA